MSAIRNFLYIPSAIDQMSNYLDIIGNLYAVTQHFTYKISSFGNSLRQGVGANKLIDTIVNSNN